MGNIKLPNIWFYRIGEWMFSLERCPIPSIVSLMVNPLSRFFTISLVFFIILYWIYSLLIMFNGPSGIQKVSFKGNSIELFTNEQDSLFDKYLDEL